MGAWLDDYSAHERLKENAPRCDALFRGPMHFQQGHHRTGRCDHADEEREKIRIRNSTVMVKFTNLTVTPVQRSARIEVSGLIAVV